MISTNKPISPNDETLLMANIFALRDDPLKFVMFNFPWGEPNTPLEHEPGPDVWQVELLNDMHEYLKRLPLLRLQGEPILPFQALIASGHGIGKSALMSWVNYFWMSTRPGSTTIVTANTEAQLTGKTWPELGRWHTMALNQHWFDLAATSLKPAKWYQTQVEKHLKISAKYFYASAVTWSEENPGAFAGTHNQYGTLYEFDEAAEIPSVIWETAEGAFTDEDGDKIFLGFGNPTVNSGRFYEGFNGIHRGRYRLRQIDSRSVRRTNKAFLDELVRTYGEDSDVVRMRVRGLFPSQGLDQFISEKAVEEAEQRDVEQDLGAPLVLGVDPGRFGDDPTVLRFRQGRDGRSIPPVELHKQDTMEVAARVAAEIERHDPDMTFVDEGGLGAGVVDRLKALRFKVTGINFGSRATEPNKHFNKRCEMWDAMKDWLGRGAIAPGDNRQVSTLRKDLIGPKYKYTGDSSQLHLERKEDMRKRGVASPNHGDALALTFAMPVARRDARSRRGSLRDMDARRNNARDVDYPVI